MLGDITVAENIYIACGYTDMRKSIDGLAAVVQEQFRWLMEGLGIEQKTLILPVEKACFC